MISFKEKNTLKRYLRYTFFVTLILWILTSLYVIYQYLRASSKQVISKGGTFIEGIFSTTSFLPYLSNDWQSKFYQGMMFDRCLEFEIDQNGRPEYKNKLCDVTTRDYKTYHIALSNGGVWSDGVPLSIEDVFFTYEEIIKNNSFEIEYLKKYSNINVEMEGDKVKVVFENSSEDNSLFFTNYILPKHALLAPNIEMYKQSFAIEPIYNNCAKIKSQSTDQYSLIFDLSDCKDTNLGFYQIKNAISFDSFKESTNQLNGSIIDAYIGDENLKGYQTINLESNKLITLFFNTKSEKMTVRLRRALGGLIANKFFDSDKDEYMKKYDRDIFIKYTSTGANISDFLSRIDTKGGLGKQELIESGIGEFTGNLNFSNKEKAYAFYTEDSKQDFMLNLKFENSYDKIAIQHNSGDLYYPSTYSKKNQSANYGIAPKNKNINPGLNSYTIFGFNKDKKEQVGSINLYNLYKEDTENTVGIKENLKILYFDNNLSNYVIGKLKQIFKEMDIEDRFTYKKSSDINELEGVITAGEYDIFLNIIDMGLTTDISKLFSVENPKTNPSQYSNARLVSLLKQYNESKNKSKIVEEINNIHSNDMPIVVLGRQYIKLNLKDSMLNKLNMEKLDMYEYNRRDIIYKNLSLTENIYIDKEKAWNRKNFWNFIKNPN
ncbi:MAG: hypothetical protein M0P94_02420 [Candidatus Absconditabacterales bacterium]|nr:hypothetical protein [Candidatus Absconditabacterales bacterium]